MAMSCDRVGNLLLAKFSAQGANDTCFVIPASIVFFLLKNLPPNQDPTLQAPPPGPQITQWDWDNPNMPRASTVNCKVMPGKISMTFNLDLKPDVTLVLDRGNVELMRQILIAYSKDLIDLDAV
jgi:hypothetical protein